jgi:hypothetical protein
MRTKYINFSFEKQPFQRVKALSSFGTNFVPRRPETDITARIWSKSMVHC